MRFTRYGRFEFRDTERKRSAFARKQRKEREAFPLFAEQIAEEQIGADEEMQKRKTFWEKSQAADRLNRANKWRKARNELNSFTEQERKKLLAFWNKGMYPGTPEYLFSMLHSYRRGTLDLEPVHPAQTEAQREAVNAVIERLLARKKSSGGQMVTELTDSAENPS